MHKKINIADVYSVNTQLFGEIGGVTAYLCDNITPVVKGKQFSFMESDEFKKIANNAKLTNQVYWKEILFRIYWASATNIMRHQRWQSGCIRAFKSPENFLIFVSSLRGLLEAALDAAYSLRPIPMTLAENREKIEKSIAGELEVCTISGDLEDRLIHFIYALKVNKNQKNKVPANHMALEPQEYRNLTILSEDEREDFKRLYDFLCGFCHPTAHSLLPFWEEKGNITIRDGQDKELILMLCEEYKSVIGSCLSLSVTSSAICLKALNWFSLTETKCPELENWNFDDVLAWKKASDVVTKNLSV